MKKLFVLFYMVLITNACAMGSKIDYSEFPVRKPEQSIFEICEVEKEVKFCRFICRKYKSIGEGKDKKCVEDEKVYLSAKDAKAMGMVLIDLNEIMRIFNSI